MANELIKQYVNDKGEMFTFYKNEDTKTIVAVLEVSPIIAVADTAQQIEKAFGKYSSMLPRNEVVVCPTNLMVQGKYVGKAVCHAEDEWDVEKGMRIAKLRALRMYNKERKQKAELSLGILKDALQRIETSIAFFEGANEKIDTTLAEIAK